jgi:succinoglycan biosynthesis protein ExoA
MPRPLYTVIIPASDEETARPAVNALPSEDIASGKLEVIVVTGRNPSRQRNAAARQAHGEILIYLDSDSEVTPTYWVRLEQLFSSPDRAIVGGPALLKQPSSLQAQTFQSLLASPRLTGSISSRYGPNGVLRQCGDSELILCNLAIRREAWNKIGDFSEALFPNEENEWMDRARNLGWTLWHDPELVVLRPQRVNLPAFLSMLIRYGRGRTQQCRLSGQWKIGRQLPSLFLVLLFPLLFFDPLFFFLLVGLAWLGLGVSVAWSQPTTLRWRCLWQAGLVPLAYAWGQLLGWNPFRSGPPLEMAEPVLFHPDKRIPQPVTPPQPSKPQ